MNFTKRLQSQRKSPAIAVLAGCLGILGSAGAPAEVLREQVIELQKGWNAVHLEVRPQDAAPAAVFACSNIAHGPATGNRQCAIGTGGLAG